MSNPTLSPQDAETLARSRGCTDKVLWLGMRSATSKYGEYDDTAGLITPEGYTEFILNTLPTIWKPHMACLQPGDWLWKQGIHGMHHLNLSDKTLPSYGKDLAAYNWLLAHPGQDHPDPYYRLSYWAYRQAGPMTVARDGQAGFETETDPTKYPMVDGHHGGLYGTSSEACQTWPIKLWQQARTLGFAAMNKYGQTRITYALHLMAV